MDQLNHALFLMLNAATDDAGAPLALFAIAAAKYLILLVPLHLALVWTGGGRTMRFVALTGVVALSIALAMNQLIGAVAYVPRPFLIGLGHTLIDHRPSSSLPSNHATVCFTYAAVLLIFGLGRLAAAVAVLGLVVAWSRIYLGVHFPLDMLAALGTSALAAYAAAWAMTRFGLALLGRAEALFAAVPGLGRLSRLRA